MKTTIFRYLNLCLIAVAMLGFTSCEVEIDGFFDDDGIGDGYYNKSRELCSRTWVDTWYDSDGNYCYQELDFYLDRHGVDYIRVEYPGGRITESEYHFDWNWDNYSQSTLRMRYGPGDVDYLYDVWIGGNKLSGYLNYRDNYVDYYGKR